MAASQAEDDPLIRALRDPARYPTPETITRVDMVQTHISVVLLAGGYAYKIKKPLRLPFLDFSTLEARKHFCDEELRLNRRLAPQLYLDVVPIGGSREHPEYGATPAIEYAVRMRRFPERDRLDHCLARAPLKTGQIHALAELIADFHRDLPPAGGDPRHDEGDRIVTAALENFDELDGLAVDDTDRSVLSTLREWTSRQGDRLAQRFRERHAQGQVRECHGDLHLENLVVIDDRVLPFDALEFDARLRTVDVIDEAAFLTMDLLAHGHAEAAFGFLGRYLECTGDYAALDLMRFYLVYRAMVRAKVRALSMPDRQPLASGDAPSAVYLRLARALLDDDAPALVITHGFSGSGKTTITERLMTRLPAVRIRSDVERKRLHGLAAEQRSGSDTGAGLYDDDATDRTYAHLRAAAAAALASGLNVIVDASFLDQARRRQFDVLAGECGARFAILVAHSPESVLRERVRTRQSRGGDASEAGTAVLDHQLAHHDPLDDQERGCAVYVDTGEAWDAEAVAVLLREQPVPRRLSKPKTH